MELYLSPDFVGVSRVRRKNNVPPVTHVRSDPMRTSRRSKWNVVFSDNLFSPIKSTHGEEKKKKKKKKKLIY